MPDCTGRTCSQHGACDTTTGLARCTCDSGHAGDDCEYELVYALDIPLSSEWNTPGDVPYATNASADTAPFDRIAYRLQLDGNFVWVDMPAFTILRTAIGIPVDRIWDLAIRDVNLRSSIVALPALQGATGSLEFWSNCYEQGLNGVFDYDDDVAPSQPDCYGSFQIHGPNSTWLAINGWSSGARVTNDLGLGTRSTAQPDWTSAANAGAFQTRRLEVFVHETE
jgi:hypothetical protein